MAEPFIFVTKHAIKEGELDNIKKLSRPFTEAAAAAEPGPVAFHFHLNDDGTEVTNVQVHKDAASMDAYLPVVRELIGQALESSTTTSIDVFGTPGPVLQEVLQLNEEQGARVTVHPTYLDGFDRAAA